MEKWLLSVCGLNCAKCDIYLASHGNEELQDDLVEWFAKKRNETIKPEQVKCEGCRGPLETHWSPDCKMRLCASRQGIQYCFQCVDFPCGTLEEFASDGVPHHKRTVENMKKMKEIGVEPWIADQEKKEQCEFCP